MAPAPLDLKNVQGDILSKGLPKKSEQFFFFTINNGKVQDFRAQLVNLVPLIRTAAQAADDQKKIEQSQKDAAQQGTGKPLLKLSGVNIAFTQAGLSLLGITDNIGDDSFKAGQLASAESLNDRGTKTSNGNFDPTWEPAFKKALHGVILITGDSRQTIQDVLSQIKKLFSIGQANATIHESLSLIGDVRPGAEKGHEHFGFLDGVSQPAVKGVDTKPNPGQETIPQGIILVGREGDGTSAQRPSWALDGSFLAFRYLHQLVPEFDSFLEQNALAGAPSQKEGADLLGARLVGRWKSGAPIDVSPLKDDPKLGADVSRNDNFRFDTNSQERCPFAAHIRKTNPRSDLSTGGLEPHRILRSGIQFGPEVSASEKQQKKTASERGLLFVSYQSDISQGFEFIQKFWVNNTDFIFGKNPKPGFDPIIGQAPGAGVRDVTGTNSKDAKASLKLPTDWVISKGGEYFFSPSLPALKTKFAKTTA